MKNKIDLSEWEEISYNEWVNIKGECLTFWNGNKDIYFKPKQKFPIVFDGDFRVWNCGTVTNGGQICFNKDDEIKAGYKAFNEAMEIRGLKDE